MSRITRIVVALVGLLAAMLLGSNSPAAAADGYGASYTTRLTVTIDALRGYDKPIVIRLQVTSDATARNAAPRGAAPRTIGDFTGTADVSIDGAASRTVNIAADGTADFDIPCNSLKVGAHAISATYNPAADSVYQSASASNTFEVTAHCVAAKAKSSKNSGGLPSTGGPWIGIIGLALLLLLAGTYLLRRKHADS